MRVRWTLGAAVAAVVAAASTACSSLPTSGPVMEGVGGDDRRAFVVAPLGPAVGADPLALVRGFLGAGVGATDNFAAARSYLTTTSGARWLPGKRVVVHERVGLAVTLSQGGSVLPEGAVVNPGAGPVTATVSAPLVAVVDADGRYQAASPGEQAGEELTAVLEAGRWRLSSAPNQLFVDDGDFSLGWSPQSLYFPDPSGDVLVPEVRWFSQPQEALPAAVATELLQGPSPWLAPAVRRPLLPRPALSSASVVVEGGTAHVDLDDAVLGASTEERGLLVFSLSTTLSALPGVSGAVVTAGGGRLSGNTSGPPPQASPVLDPSPVLLRDGAPVRWRDGRLEPVPARPVADVTGDLSGPAVPADPDSPSLVAALVGRDGQNPTLVRWGRDGAGRAVLHVDAPASLTAPAFDPEGWLWSATTPNDGSVAVVAPDGRVAAAAAPWLAGRTIVAVRPSREGARALVVSSAPGQSGDRVDVVGVRRGSGGQPEELVEPDRAPVPEVVGVVDAAWVDQSTVGVLGTASPDTDAAAPQDGRPSPRQVFTVTGGVLHPESAPGLFDRKDGDPAVPKVVSMAASDGTLLLGTEDGRVYQRAGVRWISEPSLEGSTDPSYAG